MAENELTIRSAERVAYELMLHIANYEDEDKAKFLKPDARTYFLTLFQQCIKAGHGHRKIDDILKGG